MEAFHVTDSANRSGSVIAWSFTGLALQQIVGLLPQQWARHRGGGSARAASSGTTLRRASRI